MYPKNPPSFLLQNQGLSIELGRHHWEKYSQQTIVEKYQKNLSPIIQQLFSNNQLNTTEKRAVTHVAWREQNKNTQFDIAQKIQLEKIKAEKFTQKILQENIITDVVNVGIGGSHLGNFLVCDALKEFKTSHVRGHFLSSPDANALQDLLSKLNPKTTLWLIASKSFTTFEIELLFNIIQTWFYQTMPKEAFAQHFIAITSQVENAYQQGFNAEQCFWFDEGVGGRFSLWSSVGLMIQLSLGPAVFKTLLDGAHAMDHHFAHTALSHNIPFWLAWLDYYYATQEQAHSRAVLPYSMRLRYLPAYLQQLEMESLGKSTDQDGIYHENQPGLVTWGEVEPNGQHAFHQFLYQNNQRIPIDFLTIKENTCFPELTKAQFIECLAQSKALWEGDFEQKNPHQKIAAFKPSTLILLDQLTPFNLGQLLAMYEHKVFVLGELYHINAFDQYGVELGKKLTKPLLEQFGKKISDLDTITKTLLAALLKN